MVLTIEVMDDLGELRSASYETSATKSIGASNHTYRNSSIYTGPNFRTKALTRYYNYSKTWKPRSAARLPLLPPLTG